MSTGNALAALLYVRACLRFAGIFFREADAFAPARLAGFDRVAARWEVARAFTRAAFRGAGFDERVLTRVAFRGDPPAARPLPFDAPGLCDSSDCSSRSPSR